MPDTPTFLAERLLSEGEKSVQFFKDLPHAAWECQIYTEGTQWKPLQVLAHFVATERSLNLLVEDILSGGSGAPENFDINAYNESKVAQIMDLDQESLLNEFMNQRHKTAALVNRLNLEDLEKKGRHPYLGIASLAEIIKIIYRHNQIHQRDMRRIIGEKNPG